ACPILARFSSWTFPFNANPTSAQTILDQVEMTFGPGTHTMGPLKLACNWQTDLFFAFPDRPDDWHMIASDVLEHQVCTAPPQGQPMFYCRVADHTVAQTNSNY